MLIHLVRLLWLGTVSVGASIPYQFISFLALDRTLTALLGFLISQCFFFCLNYLFLLWNSVDAKCWNGTMKTARPQSFKIKIHPWKKVEEMPDSIDESLLKKVDSRNTNSMTPTWFIRREGKHEKEMKDRYNQLRRGRIGFQLELGKGCTFIWLTKCLWNVHHREEVDSLKHKREGIRDLISLVNP